MNKPNKHSSRNENLISHFLPAKKALAVLIDTELSLNQYNEIRRCASENLSFNKTIQAKK